MTLTDALLQLREDFVRGKDFVGGLYLHSEAAPRIAGDDLQLLRCMLDALDRAAPGGNFGTWLDGGEIASDGDSFGYVYAGRQRSPAEVGLVISTAVSRARAMQQALEEV